MSHDLKKVLRLCENLKEKKKKKKKRNSLSISHAHMCIEGLRLGNSNQLQKIVIMIAKFHQGIIILLQKCIRFSIDKLLFVVNFWACRG